MGSSGECRLSRRAVQRIDAVQGIGKYLREAAGLRAAASAEAAYLCGKRRHAPAANSLEIAVKHGKV